MVSMKDVAKKCGVSVATVSKSLNGHRDVGEITRKKIAETAAEMGYFPNSAARALKTNRTYNLGVLFVDKTHSGLTHEYFSQVLDSFKVVAERRGYDITFISQNIGEGKMSYYEHCRYRGCDGVVIASVDFKDPTVLDLISSNIPVVTIDCVFNNTTSIISDNVKGVRDLVSYLVDCGHKKIAYIYGEDTSVTQNRLASFYRSCEEFGVEVTESYLKQGIYHDPSSVVTPTRELLALKSPPTCIMYPDDFSIIGGIQVIEESGLRIPEDISVVGYDGIYLSQVIRPKLTTLHQDTKALGELAAERLIEQIEHPKTTIPHKVMVEGQLIVGNSVRKLE